MSRALTAAQSLTAPVANRLLSHCARFTQSCSLALSSLLVFSAKLRTCTTLIVIYFGLVNI